MKIYTKTGDDGTTQFLSGERIKKNHPRIVAYGTVDEVNAYIGLITDSLENDKIISFLNVIKNELFIIGSILACEDNIFLEQNNLKITEQNIDFIENEIDRMNKELPELNNFLLPGGNKTASLSNIARCVCRRAERECLYFECDEFVLKYLNRLSDYLFVLFRYLIFINKGKEVLWIS